MTRNPELTFLTESKESEVRVRDSLENLADKLGFSLKIRNGSRDEQKAFDLCLEVAWMGKHGYDFLDKDILSLTMLMRFDHKKRLYVCTTDLKLCDPSNGLLAGMGIPYLGMVMSTHPKTAPSQYLGRVTTHEFGHLFGLRHHNKPYPSCVMTERQHDIKPARSNSGYCRNCVSELRKNYGFWQPMKKTRLYAIVC